MQYKERLQYLSAMAMQGFLSNGDNDNFLDTDNDDTTWNEDLANASVAAAKALIKRLDKENE